MVKSTVKKMAIPLIPSSVWPTEREDESRRVKDRAGSELRNKGGGWRDDSGGDKRWRRGVTKGFM